MVNARKALCYVVIAIPVALLALLAAGALILNTSAFRDFLQSEIQKQVLARTGAKVEIGSIDLHWTRLGLGLMHVVVAGNSEPATAPLLQAKRLEVAVEWLPLLRGKLHLRDLVLDEPVARLRIDSQGRSNLPVAPHPSTSNGPEEIFDLEIKNCAIHSGQVYYNDARIPLDADLHDLKFAAGYSVVKSRYTGTLSYDNGRLSAPQLRILHAMRAKFTATRDGLSVDPLLLTSGASGITLHGRLTNFADPSLEGTYSAHIVTAELAQAFRLRPSPAGTVVLAGKFGYQRPESGSFLMGASLKGSAQSDKLSVRAGRKPIELTAVAASYELENANLEIKDLSANLLGGAAKANWELLHVGSSAPASRIDAAVRGVSLQKASNAFAPNGIREIPLTGIANMDVRASWAASLNNLIAHVRLVVSSSATKTISQSTIPLNGLLQADYNGPRNTVSFAQSYLQTASTRFTVEGTLTPSGGIRQNIRVSGATSDLREVVLLARLVQDATQPGRPAMAIPEVGGSAKLSATIAGSAKNPQIQGQVAAQNVSVDRSRLRSVSLKLMANPSKINIQQGEILALPRGRIAFEGSASLQRGSWTETGPIALQATIRNISAADAIDVARLNYPVSGTISGQASVKGTRADPEGAATIALTHGSAWGETIGNASVKASFHQGNIQSSAELQVPAGTLTASASYKIATRQYQVNLQAKGIDLQKIPAVQRGATIDGVVGLSASGAGTFQNPQLQVHVGTPKIQIADQTVSNIDAEVGLMNQKVSLTLRATSDQGSLQAKADVALTGNRYTTASLDARDLPVAAIAANFLPKLGSELKGDTDVHLSLQGPLDSPAQMVAHVEIPTLSVAYADAQIELTHPLHADYRAGTVTLAPTQLQGTGTNLTFGGVIPISSKVAPAISANGSVDLAVLQKFVPSVRSSGQLIIHVDEHGSFLQSGMHGQLQINNAVLSADASPVGMEGLNGLINFSGDRADIARLEGAAGGGTISAAGFLTYGREPTFNLALNAQSVRIRYPQGLRSVLSGRVNIQGNRAASTITGRVLVDRLSFTQAFDLANLSSYFSEDTVSSAPSAFKNNTRLNVTVQSAQDLNLASSKLSIGGSANLSVTGTLANPILLGRIVLTNGEVFFLGKRFEVQSGTIEFANPARTNPVLSLYVTTTIEQYNVTLNLTGPIDRLRTNYTSDPALPPADIIHLLAFGNTEEEANAAPSSSMAMGAESVLAQGVSSQVAGKLENLTGISQLTIDPLALDSQGNPGAQVAIQERVTGSLLVTFSTDVTQTQSQTVEVQYQLNTRASVTVLRDQNGGYGIDLRFHKVF
jgi:translocation and assembly module TamB